MSTLFSRSTKGDPTQVIKDVLSKMTFIEVVSMAKELGIDPHVLSDYAHNIQRLQHKLPTPANDNPTVDPAYPVPESAPTHQSPISSLTNPQ